MEKQNRKNEEADTSANIASLMERYGELVQWEAVDEWEDVVKYIIHKSRNNYAALAAVCNNLLSETTDADVAERLKLFKEQIDVGLATLQPISAKISQPLEHATTFNLDETVVQLCEIVNQRYATAWACSCTADDQAPVTLPRKQVMRTIYQILVHVTELFEAGVPSPATVCVETVSGGVQLQLPQIRLDTNAASDSAAERLRDGLGKATTLTRLLDGKLEVHTPDASHLSVSLFLPT
ncbi:hypothetical protein [Thiosocius teredinicola]|uniref:hypothetical protein n=1 Tax=Thiosocius teredinicola TaxID=1973002 RepID=UPI0009913F01